VGTDVVAADAVGADVVGADVDGAVVVGAAVAGAAAGLDEVELLQPAASAHAAAARTNTLIRRMT